MKQKAGAWSQFL